ncbi:MAG: DUF3604 domain-containing protein [Cyanobacteriota bacterium]|nr:DUF3604 domain-containing protein [Cyanobacteriota bacterium]
MKRLLRFALITLAAVALALGFWLGARAPVPMGGATPSPQRRALFGDLHTHTIYSLDAYMGFIQNDPNDAYEFAQGQPKPVPGGTTQRRVPLDFAAVTDHAEFLGEIGVALYPTNPLYTDPVATAIRNEEQSQENSAQVFVDVVQTTNRSNQPSALGSTPEAQQARKTVWQKIQRAAEDNYKPGEFTTFHAFEWSSAPGGANLHRNVIFRDAVVPEVPFSALDSTEPEELWRTLAQYEQEGSTLLAIPHNGNASANQMFMPQQFNGKAIDPTWAELRARYEPLFEIMQIKGASETLPAYAPEDEFADFELFPASERTRGRYGYIREALKNGLRHQQSLGTNPFKYGLIGATDNHNGVAGDTEEDDYIGSHGFADAKPELRLFSEIPGWEDLPYLNPGALTGVWAEDNTREAIFDAFKRKETFATSGTRAQVRVFAGWDFPKNLHRQRDGVAQAYAQGVPMGGDLPPDSQGRAPRLAIWAMKDPDSANLDRVQVVKGWTHHGLTYERIYDVAWAGDRSPHPETGRVGPIGSTVDPLKATYTNHIGSADLSTVWEDPDFDPTVRAFYYVRALEIPTPRYSTRDAASLGIRPNPVSAVEIQERVWSSPIWYTPSPEQLQRGDRNALTVAKLQQAGAQVLTTTDITRLVTGQTLRITNRTTGTQFLGFYQPDGTWFLGESAHYAPLHSGELESVAPTRYSVADNQLRFNLKDGSDFNATLYRQGDRLWAARSDEIGYVNYELEAL